MSKYIISLDQGTTSSRAILFDKKGTPLSSSQSEFEQIYPHPGWVEHDPLSIYAAQYGVMMELLAKTEVRPEEIAGIGITNQRETTVIWDKNTGKPIYNAIVWQCRRTADLCEEMKKDKEFSAYISENTGLRIDAYFSASKIKWLLDNVEGAREKAENGELLFGTIDTWLIWKLTEGKVHVSDHTNASRTMLFNIKTLEWDDYILDKMGIPKSLLPEVKSSSEIYGYTNISGHRVPIAGAAGDQQAALFGQCCFNKGDMKNTYGTGCFLLMNTGEEVFHSKSGLLTTIALSRLGKVSYALEGSVFAAGATMQWFRDEMRFFGESDDSGYFASKVEDNGGVYLVPAFTGLAAPYWDMYARGSIFGITRGTTRNHIIRAGLEGIAYQVYDLIKAMESDLNFTPCTLRVDGGASANSFLMQFQADILNMNIERSQNHESTALGAAFLAGLAVGFWKDEAELLLLCSSGQTYTPSMPAETREKYLKSWKKAVKRSLLWAKDDEEDLNFEH